LTEAEEEVDLESKHYETDEHCKKASYKLPDYNLNISSVFPATIDGINTKPFFTSCTECPECRSRADHDSFNAETSRSLMPYCSIIVDVPLAPFFKTMEGIQKSDTFTEKREPSLAPTIHWLGNELEDFDKRSDEHEAPYKVGNDVEDMGHCITIGLSRNAKNWVLFNLAAAYWRIQGNAFEAIECSRRAFHFAPDKYKHMSLLNIGAVLHKHGYTRNATVIIERGAQLNVKHNGSGVALHHFTLGNLYAHMEDYSESIKNYKKAVEAQDNDFAEASERLYAVLCQAKLHHKLEQQHESLKRTLEELRKFKEKQDQYKEHIVK